MSVQALCKQLNLVISNQRLVANAFVHSSYLNEHKQAYDEDYQRLEFIGDAVLQLYSAQFLYENNKSYSEGQMTLMRAQIVSEKALSEYARQLDFPPLVLLGAGEMKQKGYLRNSLLADIFEAFIGAIYLDGGMENVRKVGQLTLEMRFKQLCDADVMDYKTRLQELVQADTRKSVTYQEVSRFGPANQPIFESVVLLDDLILGKGKGRSKKESQQEAAKDALNKMVK